MFNHTMASLDNSFALLSEKNIANYPEKKYWKYQISTDIRCENTSHQMKPFH